MISENCKKKLCSFSCFLLNGKKYFRGLNFWLGLILLCHSGEQDFWRKERLESCPRNKTRANCSRKVREIESRSWKRWLGWRGWRMIICRRPVPPDDHLQVARSSRWSFARDRTGDGGEGAHWANTGSWSNFVWITVEHIQKPKLPELYVRVETSASYFIIHNQFVK